MFNILLLCFLTSKAGGVHITTNVSTTQVNYFVSSWKTPDVMDYTIDINRYNLDLSGITSLLFEIKTCSYAHVLLSNSDVRNSSKPLYEIIIGYFNYDSFIIYRADDSLYSGSRNYTSVETPNILNCTVYLPFWISWESGDIELGTGIVVGENVVLNLTNTHHFEVKSIGVLTDLGTLGNWIIQIEVSDKFAGYFDSCSMDNTKSDMVVVDAFKCSEMRCATSCGMSRTCMGYNFNSTMNRCELLWFGSNVVSDIPHHIEAGWRFYSKCYNGKTACLGCYF
ncbi:unnamed protein product [Mytilus coruscus]|uniref:Farnesoic acid O-methyl transferase domain-containing protein n=1 Tax=Mytilus coruscus TaxID=42192 RepID=A0A6J8BQI1_MYTCO|nr:unnamed protein product [Mytilus coruscus]